MGRPRDEGCERQGGLERGWDSPGDDLRVSSGMGRPRDGDCEPCNRRLERGHTRMGRMNADRTVLGVTCEGRLAWDAWDGGCEPCDRGMEHG